MVPQTCRPILNANNKLVDNVEQAAAMLPIAPCFEDDNCANNRVQQNAVANLQFGSLQ